MKLEECKGHILLRFAENLKPSSVSLRLTPYPRGGKALNKKESSFHCSLNIKQYLQADATHHKVFRKCKKRTTFVILY